MLQVQSNEKYFSEIIRRFGRAKKGIKIIQYLAELISAKRCPAVYKVARSLVKAAGRGVDIQIILEDSNLRENYNFYRMLKDKNVDVWLDTSATYIHRKSILIDNKYLISGSHNLTEKSLTRNLESSLLTDDVRAIREFNKQFADVSLQHDSIKALKSEGVHFPISLVIETGGRGLSGILERLKRETAPYLFNLYLYFCYLDRGRPRRIPIDFEKFGRAAGLDPKKSKTAKGSHYARYYWQNRVSQMLALMEKKFKCITIDQRTRTIKRRAIASNRSKVFVPDSLFEKGWLTRLSIHSKYFWFTGQLEKNESPFSPWWSLSYRILREKYYLTLRSIKRAKDELEKHGLLEILEDKPKRGKFGFYQEPNFYRHNPF